MRLSSFRSFGLKKKKPDKLCLILGLEAISKDKSALSLVKNHKSLQQPTKPSLHCFTTHPLLLPAAFASCGSWSFGLASAVGLCTVSPTRDPTVDAVRSVQVCPGSTGTLLATTCKHTPTPVSPLLHSLLPPESFSSADRIYLGILYTCLIWLLK